MNNEERLSFKYAVNKLGKAFVVCYENEGVYHAYPIDFKSRNMLKHDTTNSKVELKDYSLKNIIGGLMYLKDELEIVHVVYNDDEKFAQKYLNTTKHVKENKENPYSAYCSIYHSGYVEDKVKELVKYLLKNRSITLDVNNLNIEDSDKIHNTIFLTLQDSDLSTIIYGKLYFRYNSERGLQEKMYPIEDLYGVCHYIIIAMLFQYVDKIYDPNQENIKLLNRNPDLTTWVSIIEYDPSFFKLYFLIPIFLNLVNNEYGYNFKDISKLVYQAENKFDYSFAMVNVNKYYYILLYIADYYDSVSDLNELEKMSFDWDLISMKGDDLIVRYFKNMFKYKDVLLDLENNYLKPERKVIEM